MSVNSRLENIEASLQQIINDAQTINQLPALVGLLANDDKIAVWVTATGETVSAKFSDMPYVPYTGATGNVDLNAKTLGNVATFNLVELGALLSHTTSTFIGIDALSNALTVDNTTALGYRAGQNTLGSSNTFVGKTAGEFNEGSLVTLLGVTAGQRNRGDRLIAIGNGSGQENQGDDLTAVGYGTGFWNAGDDNTFVGRYAGVLAQDNKNTYIGAQSLLDNAFIDWVAGEKTFADTDVDTALNRVTVTGHGWGSIGMFINLRHSSTGNTIVGAGDVNNPQMWEIIDANTLEVFPGGNLATTGSGTLKLTPQYNYSNVTTLGYNAIPSASNQVTLGDANVTQVRMGNGTILTGAPSSIVGITGTKAQFDTACTDGNFVYDGDSRLTDARTPTSHTLSSHSDIPAEPTGGAIEYYLKYNDTGDVFTWEDISTLGSGDVTKVGTPVNDEVGVWTGDGTIEGHSGFKYVSGQFSLRVGVDDTSRGEISLYGDAGNNGGEIFIWNGATGDTDDDNYKITSTSGVFEMSGSSTGTFLEYTSSDQSIDTYGAIKSDQTVANIDSTGATALITKGYLDNKIQIVWCDVEESNATTTLVLSTDLQVTLEANSEYIFEFFLHLDCLNDTPDMKMDLTGSLTGATAEWFFSTNEADDPQVYNKYTETDTPRIEVKGATAENQGITVKGIVHTAGTAGAWGMYYSQDTSSGNAIQIEVGSWLRVEKI